uniref:Uncharacterized protein n=1 Tax=Triticum urartu TaxID=4572 RepID=A0A8R7TL38_TRIUA
MCCCCTPASTSRGFRGRTPWGRPSCWCLTWLGTTSTGMSHCSSTTSGGSSARQAFKTGIGKSNLLSRFTRNVFSLESKSTIRGGRIRHPLPLGRRQGRQGPDLGHHRLFLSPSVRQQLWRPWMGLSQLLLRFAGIRK